MTLQTYDLIILGGGPAGLTAGLYAHRAGLNVLILGGETPGGQVTLHYRVENYPGFPGGVTGAELMMGWIKQVMDEMGAMPTPESVTRVDFSHRLKEVFTPLGSYGSRAVIVATGSSPKELRVPGESELSGKGVFYCATCDAPLLRNMDRQRAAVVGGGDTAFHTALALLPHAETVTVITRGPEPKAMPVLVDRFGQDPKAKIVTESSVRAVMGEDAVTGLALEHAGSAKEETIPFDAVFVGVGMSPATGFLEGSLRLNDDGFIITNNLLETSVSGVFAAGDVRETTLRQIITAAADGALAAHRAAQYIRIEC
ncbi:NAD(P)/FAD-dependent oxidoreductase [Thermodesulfobacteriota bacterium]